MTQFATLEQFREAAQFFPAGRIVPKYVMNIYSSKSKKRFKHHHLFTFATPTWMLRHEGIKLFVSGFASDGVIMVLRGKHTNLTLAGSVYGQKGNHIFSEINTLRSLNAYLDNPTDPRLNVKTAVA